MTLIDKLIEWDHQLFYLVNGRLTSPALDMIMPFLREASVWMPLYLFLLVFIWSNFGKRGLYWALYLICTAALCDIVSSHLVKEFVFRLRPCRDPNLFHPVRFLVNYCPQSSGFTSSHATNHFGAATFMYCTLAGYVRRRWLVLLLAWAALISYAQVYVGVHFPGDVLGGAAIGITLGYGMSVIFNKKTGLQFA